jgi:bifunctional enzyme Fae/Hps
MLRGLLLKQMRSAVPEPSLRRASEFALQNNVRYLQLAFNEDWEQARRILPQIVRNERILIEAGTPYIKLEGMAGIRNIRSRWAGSIVADLKTTDGGAEEVVMARSAGATAATVMGSSPVETLDRFIQVCEELDTQSMIDMLGVPDPLKVLMRLKRPPSVVVLHRGRDEETTRGKVIQYRHISRLHSKFDVLVSAAGGVDLREARSAIFNGANIVVVNLISPGRPWQGIPSTGDVGEMAKEFLATIE